MDKVKLKKIGNIVLDVVIYVFFAVCIFALICTIMAKQSSDDGAITIFGTQMRVVVSESMEKCDAVDVSEYKIKDIPISSLVFIETVPDDPVKAKAWYDNLAVGDVLTFRYVITAQQETITHRITEKTEKEGGWIIELQGDNRNSEDGVMTQTIDTTLANKSLNFIIGKVTGTSLVLGAALNFLKEPIGIVLCIILPSLIIMVYEIYKLFGALNAKKIKAEEDKHQRQEAEMEVLKLQLEMLRAGEMPAEVPATAPAPAPAAAEEAAAEAEAPAVAARVAEPVKTEAPAPQPAQAPAPQANAQPQMPYPPYYYPPMMPQMPPQQGQNAQQMPPQMPYPVYYAPVYPPQPVYPVYYVPVCPQPMPQYYPQPQNQPAAKKLTVKKGIKAAKKAPIKVYVKKKVENDTES